jgi:SAM-dependent methyltransferase
VPATQTAAAGSGSLSTYWRFQHAVAQAQLQAWLPNGHRMLVDISGGGAHAADLAAEAGHTVLRVLAADLPGLDFLASGCADGVIAEDRTLTMNLAAETLVAAITRVLRPGGRLLASVDSLVLGMAVLAEQHHWPELVDLPHAEVVLVPWPDGTITRCYGTEQLRELIRGGGLEVSWIRPRTVFSASAVSYLLGRDPDSFSRLVAAELRSRPDDSVGAQLVVSAYKPALTLLAVIFGLAVHAPRRLRPGLKPAFRHRLPATDALPVQAALDPVKGRRHRCPLRGHRMEHRLIPVRLGKVRARVGRVLLVLRLVFTSQYRYRLVQVVANFLKTLTGNADFHGVLASCSRAGSEKGRPLPAAGTWDGRGLVAGRGRFDEFRPVVPHGVDGR